MAAILTHLTKKNEVNWDAFAKLDSPNQSNHHTMTEIIARPTNAIAAEQLITAGYLPALANIFSARGITHSTQLEHSLANLLPLDQLKNAAQMATLLADAIAARKKY